MTHPRRNRFILSAFLAALTSTWQPASAADKNWTAGSGANFDWSDAANWSAGIPGLGDNLFFASPIPNPGILANPSFINLSAGSLANRLVFRDSYTLSGGSLTLGAGGLHVDMGNLTTLNSLLAGTDGLLKTGGGAVWLTNAGNTYTGTTTISNGSLIINDPGALGASTSQVVITGSGTRGFPGGQLVLVGGYLSGFDFTRDLALAGFGPIGDRSASLISIGDNTLSGAITTAALQNTRLTSVGGVLTISGSLDIAGVAGTNVVGLGGGANTNGTGSYLFTGVLTGTGTLEKTGSGTLTLNPSDTSGFSGVIRMGASTATMVSSVRIISENVLGTRTIGSTAPNSGAVLDFNTGTLEVRMDAPSLLAGGLAASVYQRNTGTIFVDHSMTGTAINGTATFGTLAFEDNYTFTLNSRNGYGVTFGTASVTGTIDANSVFTNNLGGDLTFNGNFWNNANTGASRSMTINGNGNTLINGNIIADGGASFDHTFTKAGTGLLKVMGVGSTLDGAVSVQGGTLMITDFRSLNNNGNVINLANATTTAGNLYIGTSVTPTAAGLTTNKVINLFGTTAGGAIYASQPGTLPVVLNSSFTATGIGAKTVTLGGSNKADNVINGSIPNQGANLVSLSKAGPGTWVLAGANTYTGTTLIYNGTLKLKANAATSTVLSSANAVTFNAANVYAGGTLELVGQAGVNNIQNLGALTVTQGANTLRLTPGALGGNASLVFSSLASAAGNAGLNIISPNATSTVTFTGLATGLAGSSVYYNGSNFGYSQAGVIRAPIYGSDATFAAAPTALTAAAHNEVTGNITTAGMTILSLKLDGSRNLALNSGQTLIVQAAGANSQGGILATGGESVISGGTALHTGGSGALVVRVNEETDKLTINTLISVGTTGGLTKNGAGTLVLTAANTNTGTVSINEGTIQLSGSGRVGNAVSTNIRQAGTLDLNGVSTTIASWNNNGLLKNTSTTAATLTIGSGNGTGTSFGTFEQSSGIINVVKIGTGAMTWNGVSNYTGSTTIGSTGLITVDVLADIGVPSGIGAGNSLNNAGSLIFNGSTSGLVYTGAVRDYELVFGATSASTNRLFTLSGTGVTLSSTAANNNSILWSNTGDIVHGIVGPQTVLFTGTSTADNRFNPRLTDSGTGANITSVNKTGTGVWILGGNNTYTGATTISNGTLGLASLASLPSGSNLVFNGGTLQASGLLDRELGTGANQFRFAAPAANTARFSGYSAGAEKLIVNWTGTPVWGSTANFLDNRNGLIFGAMQGTTAIGLSEVELKGSFSLGTPTNSAKPITVTTGSGSPTLTLTTGDTSNLVIGQTVTGTNIPVGSYIVAITSGTSITISANASASGTLIAATVDALPMRTIRVDSNGSTSTSFATISGVISGNAGVGLRKTGGGVLQLFGSNTYSGETNINQGTLIVQSLGHSTLPGNSSVGTNTNANLLSNAVTMGNGGTGGSVLQYVGNGEVSDRLILLNSTTGNPQIHADGAGRLILTNVVNNSSSENKLLYLRGTNTAGNMITSNLADSGGTLGVVVDSSASWILTGNNTFTGATTVSAGALGIGSENALGGTSFITISNGSMYAYAADRFVNKELRHGNNSVASFFGDNSLTFALYAHQADANSVTTVNNIAAGKTLTFNGVTADKITAARTWTVNGSGDTVVNGNLTTSTAFNLNLTYSGTGSLTLGGSNNQLNAGVITVSSGTLKVGANNALNSATTSNIIINPAVNVTATLDMNGQTDTVRGITANSLGTAFINNSAATAASLSFGNGDQPVTFIGNVVNTGAGALSLTKIGTGVASFTGGTYAHKGATVVTGGSLTLAGDVSNTSSLSVTGTGSLLALTGGFSGSTGLSGLTVGAGATLSLLDGQGTLISNLTSLSLGVGSSGTATLNMNVGTGNTDTISLLSGGSLTLGNTITFNMNDAGLEANTTYTLLNVPSGLTGLGTGNFIRGSTPGGFSTMTWTVTDSVVQITTGNLVTGNLYWRGLTNTAWNGNVNNWSDQAGTTPGITIPGAGTDVIFQANAAPGGAIVTTLEQNIKINSLSFQPSTNTPTSVTINAGAVASTRLDISPQDPTTGITLATGGPAAVTISSPFKLGADQTWNTASGTVLTLSGALQGPGSITKTGAGRVVVSAASDPAYGGATVNINGGALEIGNVTALGVATAGNLSAININTGGSFYFNSATSSTTTNPLTLNGGTLSASGNNQTYSGTVAIPTNSNINLLDSVVTTATGRTVTMSGILSGTGRLTIDSINTVSAGNQLTGALALSNNNSGWSGGLNILRGTVSVSNINALGTGDILGSGFGRVTFANAGGTTMNLSQNITLDAPNGVLELNAAASGTPVSDMTINVNGVVKIGSAANTGNALRVSQNSNNFSIINITNSIVLGNNASLTYQGSSGRALEVSAVISDGGSGYNLSLNDELYAWAVTSQTIRLSGANTFSGALSLTEGAAEFSTVNSVGGGPSNLGQGSAINLAGGTLRFIGPVSQTTNRPINITGVSTVTASLGANGTDGAVITYTGGITQVLNSQLGLTGSATGTGVITGNITQLGVASDITVNSGNWTLTGSGYSLADDILVNNAGTKLTLAPSATINTNGGANTDAAVFVRGGGELILDANDVLGTGYRRIGLADGTTIGTGTLSMNGKAVSIKRVDVGAITDGYTGYVTGTGTINLLAGATDLSDGLRVFRGTVSADISGTGTLLKQGLGDVTLSGGAVAWSGNATSRLDQGNLILDFSTNNDWKIPNNVALDMRGGTLTLDGGILDNSEQVVTSFTLASGGANTITLLNGDFNTTLNLGAITRAAGAGSLRINLSEKGFVKTTTANNATTGLLGAGAYVTVKDATGTWFARNDGSGNIVAQTSTPKTNVTTWVAGDHVSDGPGAYTGTINAVAVNSVRFDAAAGASVNISPTGSLSLTSGGVLVTDQVTGGAVGFLGGNLTSATGEVLVTHDSSQLFTLSSDLRLANIFTKTGNGALLLSGNNTYTGATNIMGGLVQLAGGNAIGDISNVTLSDDRVSTLELLSSETIGRLNGGSGTSGLNTLAKVIIGSNTLTLNTVGGSGTYAGLLIGNGTIIKQGTNNQSINNTNDQFVGNLIINEGLFQLAGIGQISASSITINKGGNLLLDNNGSTRLGTRILDTTPLFLNSADGVFSGETTVRGLAFRTDQDSGTANTETIGVLNFSSGANYVTIQQQGGVSSRGIIIAQSFARDNSATLDIRGRALGSNSTTAGGQSILRIIDANQAAFIATMSGGGGALGTPNVSIVPWAIGENTTVALTAAHMGNSFVTYVAGRGFIALDFATEYATYAAAAATNNVRESLTSSPASVTGKTLNSLVLHNNAIAAAAYNFTGTGTGGQTLTINSGALLFTLNPAAVAGAYGLTLSGFDGGIKVGPTNEYIFHVVNPDNSKAALLTATVSSPLNSTADITKSGRGVLILTGTNSAGGGARKTTINEGTLEIADLDNIGGNTGSLVFAGGTLRLATGFTDDFSSRSISLLAGGATIDTNGISLSLANSIGSGAGGLTKIGAGVLTLNAAATYTGATTLTGGSIVIGANNAIGSGNLTLNAGTTLALGAFNINVGLVTTAGASPNITGAGNIYSSGGYVLNHTGNTTISANLSSISGGLTKTQTNVVTLSGSNTYTGITEVQNGGLSFNSVGNIGSGASALGNPSSAQVGIIRMGSAALATSLTYTGSGHSTDRVIAMLSSTGGITLNANGTGAIQYGGVKGFTEGVKSLTLAGTAAAALVNNPGRIEEGAATLSLIKNDASTWELSTANTYSGNTSISAGILRISNGAALGSTPTTVTITGNTSNAVLELTNNITVAGKTITVEGRQAAGINNSHVRNLSGDNEFAGNINFAAGGSNYNIESAAGNLTLSGQISGAVATNARTLQFTGAGNGNVTGTIINGPTANIIVNKTGAGVWTFSGVNTYDNGTNINAGTLLINNLSGSGTGTGAVAVNANGTLGGMGTISGAVTVASTGVISPGGHNASGISTAGQLTVGTLTANTGSTVFLQIGGATLTDAASVSAYQSNPSGFTVPNAWTDSYVAGSIQHDQILITGSGTPTIGGVVQISPDYLNGFVPSFGQVFHFVDWTTLGTTPLAGTPTFNLPTVGGMNWDTNFFTSHGIIILVPEPSRVLLLVLGSLVFFIRRRR